MQYQAAQQVADSDTLQQVLHELLADEKRAGEMGERARQLIEQNSGALDKMMTLLKPYLELPKLS